MCIIKITENIANITPIATDKMKKTIPPMLFTASGISLGYCPSKTKKANNMTDVNDKVVIKANFVDFIIM